MHSQDSGDESYYIVYPLLPIYPSRELRDTTPEPKVTKNRVHLDLHADDPVAEAERLCGFGATTRTALQEQGGFRWLVMADPEGNEFCVGTMPVGDVASTGVRTASRIGAPEASDSSTS